MKRIMAFILCACMVFLLSACAEKEEKTKTEHSVDVEYYAKIGQIPEHTYHLGADADEMEEAFEEEDERNEENAENDPDAHLHSVYGLMERDDYSILSYNGANYYFKDDGKISAIVSLDDAYGFKIGQLSPEIKKALSKFETEEKKGTEDVIFFLPAAESYTYFEYKFGENTVIFTFQNNALCAVALVGANYS